MSVFRHSRVVPASPRAVFAAFEDPVRLARWWGPDGFSNTFHTFEFRQGGSWRFTMHSADGTDYPNESEFLEIVPDALIRIRHVNLPHFELSVSFDSSANGTLISWVSVFENEDFAENARQFLETANEQNLDRLTREVKTGTHEVRSLDSRLGARAEHSSARAALGVPAPFTQRGGTRREVSLLEHGTTQAPPCGEKRR